ncbi:hypothetical protein BDV95DRAFT_388479 [Massariosphaeria phaeospora]|uniref:Uncharacterized protein n=1 Tax=Massariosphaeria phaeospora TaxID=100035 RepID=A0A7C8I7E3_9PLEO|nr:hypothetical protein BDV95DRAFT_388479 [Massariosphaeria phaeospora]
MCTGVQLIFFLFVRRLRSAGPRRTREAINNDQSMSLWRVGEGSTAGVCRRRAVQRPPAAAAARTSCFTPPHLRRHPQQHPPIPTESQKKTTSSSSPSPTTHHQPPEMPSTSPRQTSVKWSTGQNMPERWEYSLDSDQGALPSVPMHHSKDPLTRRSLTRLPTSITHELQPVAVPVPAKRKLTVQGRSRQARPRSEQSLSRVADENRQRRKIMEGKREGEGSVPMAVGTRAEPPRSRECVRWGG